MSHFYRYDTAVCRYSYWKKHRRLNHWCSTLFMNRTVGARLIVDTVRPSQFQSLRQIRRIFVLDSRRGAYWRAGDSPVTAISLDERARSRCGCIVAPSPGVPRGALSIMQADGCGGVGRGGLRRRWGLMLTAIKHENLEPEELCSERAEIIGLPRKRRNFEQSKVFKLLRWWVWYINFYKWDVILEGRIRKSSPTSWESRMVDF